MIRANLYTKVEPIMIGSWIRANSHLPKSGHLKLNWTNLQDLVLFLILLLIVKKEKKKKEKKASNIIKLKNQDFWICMMNITAAQIELSELTSTFLNLGRSM